MSARIAVLASGGGSNLQALFDYFAGATPETGDDAIAHADPTRIVWVGSNRADAGALARARAANIATGVIADHTNGSALLDQLHGVHADLLVLAGYLKLVPANVVSAFRGRIINVHPALLPAFGGHGMYGQRVHDAVLAHGARVSGVTVHFVDEQFDRGATIAQWPVLVHVNDTAASLAARVLQAEHQLLPRAVAAVANGLVSLDAHGKTVGEVPLPELPVLSAEVSP